MTSSELLLALESLPVDQAAIALLGSVLTDDAGRAARICEVEAYSGTEDPASHGSRGPTPRNHAMFGPPGLAYVYFCYGVHWMLNVSARPVGKPGAILIRAAVPLEGLESMYRLRPKAKRDKDLLSGPGKLAQAFSIDRSHYGLPLLDPTSQLQIEPASHTPEFIATPRIGIPVGKGHLTPWRFVTVADKAFATRLR